jgi:hypothetical protein
MFTGPVLRSSSGRAEVPLLWVWFGQSQVVLDQVPANLRHGAENARSGEGQSWPMLVRRGPQNELIGAPSFQPLNPSKG